MPKMIGSGLSRREREIVDILTARGHASATEILAAMPDPPTDSAVRSILRILVNKGHARYEMQGKKYVYFPAAPKPGAAVAALRQVVQTFFGGSIEHAVKSFLTEKDAEISESELAALTQAIDEARKQERRAQEI